MSSKMIPFPGTYQGEREELTGWFPAARLTLQVATGPLRGRQFVFDGGPFVIGRSATATVAIPSKGVSRTHARIEFGNGSYWLIPEQTVNGTRVNGELVHEPHALEAGDQMTIFDSTFVVLFREPDDTSDFGEVAEPPPRVSQPYPTAHTDPALRPSMTTLPGEPYPPLRSSAPVMDYPQVRTTADAAYPTRQSGPIASSAAPPEAARRWSASPADAGGAAPPEAVRRWIDTPVDSGYPRPSAPGMAMQDYPHVQPSAMPNDYPHVPAEWQQRGAMMPVPAPMAAPAARNPHLVWILGGAGVVLFIVMVVIVTVKVMAPSAPAEPVAAAAEPARPPPKVEPPKVEPPRVEAPRVEPKPADTPAATPEPPAKLVGTLAIESSQVAATERGTIVEVVKVGTALKRDAPLAKVRINSAEYQQAYAKLVTLQRKYGNSEDYADFIAQARQDFAYAARRRPVKPITAELPGTVTRVAVKVGTEVNDRTVVAEVAVARITVPVEAVDGGGKRCTTQLPGSTTKLGGTLLDVGSKERTLELDRVPSGAKPGELGELRLHCPE